VNPGEFDTLAYYPAGSEKWLKGFSGKWTTTMVSVEADAEYWLNEEKRTSKLQITAPSSGSAHFLARATFCNASWENCASYSYNYTGYLDEQGFNVMHYTINVQAPGTLQFSAATYSVNENGGSATITVTRTGGSNGAVGVSYATSNGTATAGSDYTATSGTLSWANGDTASKTFSIPILDDSVYEGNETVNLTLTNATGGATLGSPSTAVLTIVENDPEPVYRFYNTATGTHFYTISESEKTSVIQHMPSFVYEGPKFYAYTEG
jgi:hypothetical protein